MWQPIQKKMQTTMTPFFMAVALLTRIPVGRWLPHGWDDDQLAASAVWYPVVGFVIAVVLITLAYILPDAMSPWVASLVIVASWVAITGALHLDGLADSVDAIYAGHFILDRDSSRDRMLQVLKDPAVGVIGVVVLLLTLMAKWVLVASLWPTTGVSLLCAIVIARVVALIFMVTTPYSPHASKAGLGAVIANKTNKSHVIIASVFIGCCLFFYWSMVNFLIILAALLFLFYGWKNFWIKKIDGFVGDTIGALIELTELWLLFLLYCLYL